MLSHAIGLAQGESILRRLEKDPSDGDAYDALGVVALANGAEADAIPLFVKAIQMNGPEPRFCAHLGEALAHFGEFERAAVCFQQALDQVPDDVHLLFTLGNLHHLCGRAEESGNYYQTVVNKDPGHAEGWFNLGVTRTIQARLADALHAYRNAVECRPLYAEAWNNLAILEIAQSKQSAAEACYRRALLVRPDYKDALYNFADLLYKQERLAEAAAIYERLISVSGGFAEAHNNLGNTYLKMNRLHEAQSQYAATLAIHASHREAPWNMGIVALLSGDLRRGWVGYEQRLVQHDIKSRNWIAPRWDGNFYPGQRILVHHEQGIGDTIQFARYLPLLKQGGFQVEVLCHTALHPLLETQPYISRCAHAAEEIPPSDWQVPFPSLAYHFATCLESIPDTVPYFSVDAKILADWQRLFAELVPAKRRIGLVWQGNQNHHNDHNRSMPVDLFEPLLGLKDCQFFSLQKNHAGPLPALVRDLSPLLTNFGETAAAVACLDLVISVDTAVAHLAGALGRPVWTMIPYAPDWRWMLDRSDSPWYPSMRLFRQPMLGDWSSVIREVARALDDWNSPKRVN